MNTRKILKSLFIHKIRIHVHRIWNDPRNFIISIHLYLPHSQKSIKKILDKIEKRKIAICKINHCILSIKNMDQYHATISMIEHYGIVYGKDSVFDDLLQAAYEQYEHML